MKDALQSARNKTSQMGQRSKVFKSEETPQELSDCIKRANIRSTGKPKEERENRVETYLKT